MGLSRSPVPQRSARGAGARAASRGSTGHLPEEVIFAVELALAPAWQADSLPFELQGRPLESDWVGSNFLSNSGYMNLGKITP